MNGPDALDPFVALGLPRPGGAHRHPRLGAETTLVPMPPDPAPRGTELAVTIDALVDGVHFPTDTDPADIGFKAMAVNLSDLAAMGAEPVAALLALTIPHEDRGWLRAFGAGLRELPERHRVDVSAACLSRGPLTVTVQAYGHVPAGAALQRSGAHPGDVVFVTGTLGDAGLALAARGGGLRLSAADRSAVEARLNRPVPRLAAGIGLRGIASSAIDISDGLAADLGHILERSGVGAALRLSELPLSAALQRSVSRTRGWDLALASGDDYELCFTVPPDRLPQLERIRALLGCPVRRIGVIEAAPGLRCLDDEGTAHTMTAGFQHFR